MANVLSKIINAVTRKPATGSVTVEAQGGGFYDLSNWNGNLYDSDIVRSAIWTNAKNVGKLNPKHIRETAGKYDPFPSPRIRRILERPNQFMGMSVFLNKMATQCFKKNNAFALVNYGKDGCVEGLYPISYTSVEAVESNGFFFIKFMLPNGKTLVVPYNELIHLRLHIDEKDVFGEDNQKPLQAVMDVIQTTDSGMVKAIKNSAVVRWILKFQNVLDPDDKEREIKSFIQNYLSIENAGGAAGTDPRYEAEPVKQNAYIPNAVQMSSAKERIYSYFGISEAIIQSKFKEDEWDAYYENTLEPIAIQLSEEFTERLFTETERAHGNKIIFEANRLQYASAKTKVQVGQFLSNLGSLELDQILQIFNIAPIGGEEGKRRVQTLNMVNAQIADQYQLGEPKKTEDGVDEDGDTKES